MIMEYDGSYSSEPSKKPKAMAGRLSAQDGRTKKAPYVSNEEGEESLEGKMESWDGSGPSRSDNGYDDDNIIVPSTTVAVTEQNSTAPTHAKYKGNIVEIPNGQNGSAHKYILINKRNERAATEYLTNDIFFSKKSFYENPILSSDDFIFESLSHAIAHVASPLSFFMSFSVEDNKKNSLEQLAPASFRI